MNAEEFRQEIIKQNEFLKDLPDTFETVQFETQLNLVEEFYLANNFNLAHMALKTLHEIRKSIEGSEQTK